MRRCALYRVPVLVVHVTQVPLYSVQPVVVVLLQPLFRFQHQRLVVGSLHDVTGLFLAAARLFFKQQMSLLLWRNRCRLQKDHLQLDWCWSLYYSGAGCPGLAPASCSTRPGSPPRRLSRSFSGTYSNKWALYRAWAFVLCSSTSITV